MTYLIAGAILFWAGTIVLILQPIADKQWKLYPERYIAQAQSADETLEAAADKGDVTMTSLHGTNKLEEGEEKPRIRDSAFEEEKSGYSFATSEGRRCVDSERTLSRSRV